MFNKEIKIAYFGNSEFSLIILDELKKKGIFPSLIVTAPDKPQGRKMILTPTPTKVWAEINDIEFIEPAKHNDANFLNKIKDCDLFLVASYGKIIPKVIIDMPKYKVLNIHPSLLPKYRGPSPIQEQILNDEKEVGVTIIVLDEQIDHGPIIVQEKIELASPLGFHALQEMLAKKSAELLAEMLPNWIKGKIKTRIQDDSQATLTKKIEKQNGFLDLEKEPYKNYLKILAFEEWPKTYFEVNKKDKKIRVVVKKADWKDNQLEIQRVIPEGKKEMDYKSFLLGLK
jgi:methionyl-tRNA formyltransferase